MKENKYDDESFFRKYAEMNRSREGLKGAGEWSELQKMLPDFRDRKVLDLGCGYGWHCKYAAENGAGYVLGTDLSDKMLETARSRNSDERIEYRRIAMEDLELPVETFDIVMSSLAFHYIRDFEALAVRISKWLKPDGVLVFSVEHPVFTSSGTQDWHYDEQGEILHFPVDRYYEEGQRTTLFLDEHVTKYHRTLTTYLNTLLRKGFELQQVIEPEPPADMLHLEGMKNERRRPMMLLVSARKKR